MAEKDPSLPVKTNKNRRSADQRPSDSSTNGQEVANPLLLDGLLNGPGGLLGAGSIENQVTRLGDSALSGAQQQAAGAKIGQIQGNRHLQRLVASIGKGQRVDLPPLSEIADMGEIAEAGGIQQPGRIQRRVDLSESTVEMETPEKETVAVTEEASAKTAEKASLVQDTAESAVELTQNVSPTQGPDAASAPGVAAGPGRKDGKAAALQEIGPTTQAGPNGTAGGQAGQVEPEPADEPETAKAQEIAHQGEAEKTLEHSLEETKPPSASAAIEPATPDGKVAVETGEAGKEAALNEAAPAKPGAVLDGSPVEKLQAGPEASAGAKPAGLDKAAGAEGAAGPKAETAQAVAGAAAKSAAGPAAAPGGAGGAGAAGAPAKGEAAAGAGAGQAAAGVEAVPTGAGAPAEAAPADLAAMSTGDLSLVDDELAEHQRWGGAEAKVGEAGSTQRAEFVAEAAGGGVLTGFGKGAAMGFAMGLAGQALNFIPIPGVGAILAGGMSAYNLATRDWSATGETISKFGEGSDIYEQLANSIAAIAEIIDVATNIMNVIAGILGIISAAMWIITVVTVGVAAPLATTLSVIALEIVEVSSLLGLINSLVLQPCVMLFRAMHAFTSQADPRDIEMQGAQISSAAAAAGGALGGLAGGKLAGGGEAPAEEGTPPVGEAEPTPIPPAEGPGPVVEYEAPPGAGGGAGGPESPVSPMAYEVEPPAGAPAPAAAGGGAGGGGEGGGGGTSGGGGPISPMAYEVEPPANAAPAAAGGGPVTQPMGNAPTIPGEVLPVPAEAPAPDMQSPAAQSIPNPAPANVEAGPSTQPGGYHAPTVDMEVPPGAPSTPTPSGGEPEIPSPSPFNRPMVGPAPDLEAMQAAYAAGQPYNYTGAEPANYGNIPPSVPPGPPTEPGLGGWSPQNVPPEGPPTQIGLGEGDIGNLKTQPQPAAGPAEISPMAVSGAMPVPVEAPPPPAAPAEISPKAVSAAMPAPAEAPAPAAPAPAAPSPDDMFAPRPAPPGFENEPKPEGWTRGGIEGWPPHDPYPGDNAPLGERMAWGWRQYQAGGIWAGSGEPLPAPAAPAPAEGGNPYAGMGKNPLLQMPAVEPGQVYPGAPPPPGWEAVPYPGASPAPAPVEGSPVTQPMGIAPTIPGGQLVAPESAPSSSTPPPGVPPAPAPPGGVPSAGAPPAAGAAPALRGMDIETLGPRNDAFHNFTEEDMNAFLGGIGQRGQSSTYFEIDANALQPIPNPNGPEPLNPIQSRVNPNPGQIAYHTNFYLTDVENINIANAEDVYNAGGGAGSARGGRESVIPPGVGAPAGPVPETTLTVPGGGPAVNTEGEPLGTRNVELRYHSENPRAPAGAYSRTEPIVQINTPSPNFGWQGDRNIGVGGTTNRYLLPDGRWVELFAPGTTEAERTAAHWPVGQAVLPPAGGPLPPGAAPGGGGGGGGGAPPPGPGPAGVPPAAGPAGGAAAAPLPGPGPAEYAAPGETPGAARPATEGPEQPKPVKLEAPAGEKKEPGTNVERVNPEYPNPPGTPEQLALIQNEIVNLLGSRAKAEQAEAQMAQQEQSHQANQGPIQQAVQGTKGAITAAEAHKKAVANKAQANQDQQQKQEEGKGLIDGYPSRAAGISALRVPLAAFQGFTHIASELPGSVGASFMKMAYDADNLDKAFTQMDMSMAQQKDAQPARKQELAGDDKRIQTTGQQADKAGQDLEKANEGAESLQQANEAKIQQAKQAKTQVAAQKAELSESVDKKQDQAKSLADQLQAWAVQHKAARDKALQETKQKLQSEGYVVKE